MKVDQLNEEESDVNVVPRCCLFVKIVCLFVRSSILREFIERIYIDVAVGLWASCR